ncbi:MULTISPECIES: hypothetical protein [Bacillus]|uniref:hypothetical protein n=1 Tax=Bacillus TaxID=1386 RepID=UPI00397950CB
MKYINDDEMWMEVTKRIERQLHEQYEANRKYQQSYPIDIPNDVCNHAILNGIQIDNNFNPKVHDFVPFMKLDDEELFIWTHKKNSYSALVSKVSKDVKNENLWKNIGAVISLAYSYSTTFEHSMKLDYKWCYYFDSNKLLLEHTIYNKGYYESLPIGTVLKLNDLYAISPLIELLLRDEKAFTSISLFYASLNTHFCCLICELNKKTLKSHPSHEPELWEQASQISDYEAAIVQACRCVEALLGKPPNKQKQKRFSEHKEKWIKQFDIEPDEDFLETGTTFIDFYYELFNLRNKAAHSYGTISFELERKQTVDAQCFAYLILRAYVEKHVLTHDRVTKALSIDYQLIKKTDDRWGTNQTFKGDN